MLDINFQEHNKKSSEIWQAYMEGNPIRVPVIIYADVRNWIHEPEQNKQRVTLSQYLKDPDLMFECQVQAQEWIRLNILSDGGMGYPEEHGWSVMVDFQNYFEQVWLGGELVDGLEPHSPPFLNEENKHMLFDAGIPDAFTGIGAVAKTRYEHFVEKAETFTYKGIPVKNIGMPFNMTGTDGPFTVACGIRGMEGFVCDMMDDPEYAQQLMDFLTTAIIQRIRKTREYLNIPLKTEYFGMADDAIVLLSPDMYKEFVLPFHKRIYNELTAENGSRDMHLCGNAQHFFPAMVRELGISSFDTGFPIQFEKLYTELPANVRVNGGPQIGLVKHGTKEQIAQEVKHILSSGVMEKSKKFVLREANALSPGTPLENVNAIYEACEKYGYYR